MVLLFLKIMSYCLVTATQMFDCNQNVPWKDYWLIKSIFKFNHLFISLAKIIVEKSIEITNSLRYFFKVKSAHHSVCFSGYLETGLISCSYLSHIIFQVITTPSFSLYLYFQFPKEFLYYEIQLFAIEAASYFHLLVNFDIFLLRVHCGVPEVVIEVFQIVMYQIIIAFMFYYYLLCNFIFNSVINFFTIHELFFSNLPN